MIPLDLTTKRTLLEDGSSAFAYRWHGEDILVRDNANTALKIFLLFNDEEMDENDKAVQIIGLMFADPDDAFMCCDYDGEEFGKLINAVTWDIFGIDNSGSRTSQALWDVCEDAAFIRTSLRMAYDIDWDEERDKIPWAEFVHLVAALPYETPLGLRIYYRNNDNRPKKTKHNKEQVVEFDKLHRLFALEQKHPKQKSSHDSAKAANNVMNDFAMALRNSKR